MDRKIKILMHTHWDREWYFTKDETKVLLRNHMQEVLVYLEEHPDCIYILDGQSVMIDDYLEMDKGAEKKLRKYIQNGQLRVGPFYTQTDLLLVHGESVFRNLYYGIKRAREFGKPMLIGYAPDTFGHASQMPQIYNTFSIGSTFFWRGFSELKAQHSDFFWEGVDGTRILGVNLAAGYQGAKYLEEEEEALKNRMEKIMKVLDTYSRGSGRLVMNGHDQMPIQKNIDGILETLRKLYPEDELEIGDFESYLETLPLDKLETVKGELTHSKHARIHRTIGSTRMDIKLLNTEIENKLFHLLEPLAVIGVEAGIEYPHGVIEEILKILFGVHAHDSIGGCNSDAVNRDIYHRLLNAKEMVDTQLELHLRLLALARPEKNTIVLMNPLPENREEEMVELVTLTRQKNFTILDEHHQEIPFSVLSQEEEDAGLTDRQVAARLMDIKVYRSRLLLRVENMDGLSVKYLHLHEERSSVQAPMEAEGALCIENHWGVLQVEGNQISYQDKITGIYHANVFYLENSGDAGDSYDYSPPVNDLLVRSADFAEITGKRRKGMGFQELQLNIQFPVPETEKSRERGDLDKIVSFEAVFRLYEKDPKVYGELRHNNTVKDSRFRGVFSTGIVSDEVQVDGYLSSQNKKVYLKEELAIWEKDQWVEKPVSIETMQSYAVLHDERGSGYLYTEGLKEYEVLEDRIHFTLFRAFSHLGKRNLVNRPGRPSGIEIETPDNQLQGTEFHFRFAFSFHLKDVNPAKESKKYLAPVLGYHKKEFNRFNINRRNALTAPQKMLHLPLQEVAVSAVKRTEEGNEVFVRIFNPENREITLEFPEGTFLANGMEEKLRPLEKVQMRPQEILQVILSSMEEI